MQAHPKFIWETRVREDSLNPFAKSSCWRVLQHRFSLVCMALSPHDGFPFPYRIPPFAFDILHFRPDGSDATSVLLEDVSEPEEAFSDFLCSF